MDALKRKRGSVKAKLTRLQTFLDEAVERTRQALSARLESLEKAWLEYIDIHSQILELTELDPDIEIHELDYVQTEDKYFKLKEALGTRLMVDQEENSRGSTATPASVDIKLPRIELPKFSGNFLDWSSFYDLFSSIIHMNEKLSAGQKLHYLKNSLQGEAAGLLQAIEVTDANYNEAWTLLTDRYHSKRQLVQCHLSALFGQPNLSTESAPGLRKLLDTTVKHVRSLHALGIKTENWDPLLVFMVTDRLDHESRKQWELSTTTKEYPNFEELKTFIEQRCRAFQASVGVKATQRGAGSNRTREKPQHSFYAAPEGPSVCPVCGDQHSVYQCSNFQKFSYQEKTDMAR